MSEDHDREHDHDHEHEPDHPGPDTPPDTGRAVARTPERGAITPLAELGAALQRVDTAAVLGRSSALPKMLFKKDDNGTWSYGQQKTVPEAGARWAVNIRTFTYGYISFGANHEVLDELQVPVTKPKPDFTKLRDTGAPWVEEWCVNLKCLSGADAGVEVTFKTTTDGGIKMLAQMIELVSNRINGGQHEGKTSPVVLLGKDSYPHRKHGRVWTPVADIIDWMPEAGPPPPAPAPAPTPTSPPSTTTIEPPRRRRVFA